jgi:LCP family protein required for cell wall assembly
VPPQLERPAEDEGAKRRFRRRRRADPPPATDGSAPRPTAEAESPARRVTINADRISAPPRPPAPGPEPARGEPAAELPPEPAETPAEAPEPPSKPAPEAAPDGPASEVAQDEQWERWERGGTEDAVAAPPKAPAPRKAPASPKARAAPEAPSPPKAPSPPEAPPPPGVAPGGRPRPKVPRAVVLRQRRRRRRTIIGVTILLCVTNLVVGGGVAYVRWRLGEIRRLKVAGLAPDASGQVMNVLLVGSDSRARLSGDAAAQAGKDEVGGERSDTIMVLHIDPSERKAAILSIPRDLYLPIAGTGRSDKINAAFSAGGATGLIATLQQGLGIPINHYAEVDFVGFRDIVNAVGGVTIYVPSVSRDTFSGLTVGKPGCVKLDGIAALAWVRSRHYEYLSDGKWLEDPRGDLGRIERQQDFIRRMMKKAVASGISNPLTLNRLIGIGVSSLTIDSTMSSGDITRLGRRFNSIDPDVVQTLTLPTTPANLGGPGGAVLMLDKAAASSAIDVLNGRAPSPAAPTTTTPPTSATSVAPPTTLAPGTSAVRVLNGTSAKGAAAGAATTLKGAGYTVSGTGDAGAQTARTTIRYPAGAQSQAQALADRLQGGAQLQADPKVPAKSLVLVIGSDYTGVQGAPGAVGGASPTTAAPVPTPVPRDAAPRRGC